MYYDIVKGGERIKELRKVAGITRQSLAEKAGISVDALRKIEQGINGAKPDFIFAFICIFSGKGGRNPSRAMKFLGTEILRQIVC